MSTTTTITIPPKACGKRPVAQRLDSSLDINHGYAKRQYVQPKRIHHQHQSQLFRLPLELRLMIYEFALPSPALSSLLSSTIEETKHLHVESATEPALVQTCRLAREEALPLFYRHNEFLLPRRPSLDYQHPLTLSMNPAFIRRKSKKIGLSTKWLYALSTEKISKISTVVFAQLGRGMYKDQVNQWRTDASACFKITLLGGRRARASGGKGFEVEYLQVEEGSGNERYAERLAKALELRMEVLVGEKAVTSWTREDIWDLAYLL